MKTMSVMFTLSALLAGCAAGDEVGAGAEGVLTVERADEGALIATYETENQTLRLETLQVETTPDGAPLIAMKITDGEDRPLALGYPGETAPQGWPDSLPERLSNPEALALVPEAIHQLAAAELVEPGAETHRELLMSLTDRPEEPEIEPESELAPLTASAWIGMWAGPCAPYAEGGYVRGWNNSWYGQSFSVTWYSNFGTSTTWHYAPARSYGWGVKWGAHGQNLTYAYAQGSGMSGFSGWSSCH